MLFLWFHVIAFVLSSTFSWCNILYITTSILQLAYLWPFWLELLYCIRGLHNNIKRSAERKLFSFGWARTYTCFICFASSSSFSYHPTLSMSWGVCGCVGCHVLTTDIETDPELQQKKGREMEKLRKQIFRNTKIQRKRRHGGVGGGSSWNWQWSMFF